MSKRRTWAIRIGWALAATLWIAYAHIEVRVSKVAGRYEKVCEPIADCQSPEGFSTLYWLEHQSGGMEYEGDEPEYQTEVPIHGS